LPAAVDAGQPEANQGRVATGFVEPLGCAGIKPESCAERRAFDGEHRTHGIPGRLINSAAARPAPAKMIKVFYNQYLMITP
jgi:hypothetical protein